MLKVITTVGTSIFDNYVESSESNLLDRDYLNNLYSEINENKNKRIKDKIKKWIERINDRKQVSAEIKSLLKLKDEKQDKTLNVYLLATDTIASSLAAEIIKEILEKEGLKVFYNPDNDVIKDLQMENTSLFVKHGLSNLVNRIELIADGYYGNVVFNITGGYKGIIPYMTIMGIINKCEIKYIYENSERLMSIPQLPLQIDEDFFEKNYNLLFVFEKGVEKYSEFKKSNFKVTDEMERRGLIEFVDNIALLSPIGQILFQNYKSKFFWFYCSDDVFEAINRQVDIKRILQEKFSTNYQDKTEYKNGHFVYDDGNNPNRIFYFEENSMIYIYKTFENHDEYEKYLRTPFSNELKRDYIKESKLRKIERFN